MGNITLDRIDCEIIKLLQKNARLSNKELAAAVRLAPSTCHARIKRLQTSGVIRGAYADVNLRTIGLNLEAIGFIKLAKLERSVIERFMNELASIPEVCGAYLVSGRYDLIVHVAVKDIDHLRNLGLDRFTNQPAVVDVETSVVFDSRTRHELPILLDAAQPTRKSGRLKRTRR